MRVVFYSNIFISAFVMPESQAGKAIRKILEESDTLVISKEILDEVLTVLSRKFSRDREAISHTAVFLSELAEVVRPVKKIKVLKDDPDNRIIECAIAGNAEAVITGDKEMLQLKNFRGIRILSLREYLQGE